MLGAVIRNGDHTLVVDLPTGMMDLQTNGTFEYFMKADTKKRPVGR